MNGTKLKRTEARLRQLDALALSCGAFNCFAEEPGTMAIHTGLSVTVAGHVLQLERDERNKIARIVVKVLDGHKATGVEGEAILAAAALLRKRAERFLGDWKVIGLSDNYKLSSKAG